MDDNKKMTNRDSAKVVGGVILVIVGGALLLRNMGYFLPYWLFTWPMILILVGVYSGVRHNFQNNSWIILIAIGSFFLIDDFLPNIRLQPAFWPLVIIGLGLLFIFRPSKKNFFCKNKEKSDFNQPLLTGNADESSPVSGDNNDVLKIESVFSGVNRNVLSKNFLGGKISCVFGGAEIDCSQADIKTVIVLKVDVVFGGVKLIVPANWSVQNEIEGVFHSVEDKRRYNANVFIDPAKVLILRGSTIFGGVEIKSY